MTNNNGSILADSIAHIPHLQAFDLLAKKRFSDLQLDTLLVYLIDTVPASALPFLAAQFDVLGYKGMRLAQNETEQREIIKRSIELHRFKGTLWAVEEALRSIGYGDAVIEEHVEGHWAKFRVTIDVGSHPLNVLEIDDLIKMIKEYKNTRSHLADLSYTIRFEDGVIVIDEQFDGQGYEDEETLTVGGNFLYNGVELFNGSRNFSNDTDVLTIQII